MSLQALPQASPIDAPPGIDALIGWTTAAQFWHCHVPVNAAVSCGRCQCRWPLPSFTVRCFVRTKSRRSICRSRHVRADPGHGTAGSARLSRCREQGS